MNNKLSGDLRDSLSVLEAFASVSPSLSSFPGQLPQLAFLGWRSLALTLTSWPLQNLGHGF